MSQYKPVPHLGSPGGRSGFGGRLARHVSSFKDNVLDLSRGWRPGIILSIFMSLVVLVLNIILTAISYFNKERNIAGIATEDTVSTFKEGDCTTIKNLSLATHLLVNILATILLGASNYCAQILASPTRQEVDNAHGKHIYLRIGVPNVQNLLHIDWRRSALCVLLGISSIPLHLIWNSAIIQTVSSNDFYVGGVTEDFANGGNLTVGVEQRVDGWFQGNLDDITNLWLPSVTASNRTNLTVPECIKAYGQAMVQNYSNVAVVFSTQNSTNSLLFVGTHITGANSNETATEGLGDNWVCGLPAPDSPACKYKDLAEDNSTHWAPLSYAADRPELHSSYLNGLAESNVLVKYCLAEPVHSTCRIAATMGILYIVVAANALKVFCFVCTFFLVKHRATNEDEERIVTNGDLVASYLRQSDTRFAGRCLASARVVRQASKRSNVAGEVGFWGLGTPMPMPWLGGKNQNKHGRPDGVGPGPVQQSHSRWSWLTWGRRKSKAEPTTLRWFAGPSGTTWLVYVLPATFFVAALLGLYFGYGLGDRAFLGFGTASTQTTISLGPGSGPGRSLGVLKSTLIASLPQLAATYVYVACNSVLTTMLAHQEMSTYAVRRRGLRVSHPCPGTAQCATYFLQLPLKIALPLMVTSTALHWLLSESLFLLRVVVRKPDGHPGNIIATVGWSATPVIASLSLMAALIIGVVAVGWFNRYEGSDRMPLVATCSASLAAATCPPLNSGQDDGPLDGDTKAIDEALPMGHLQDTDTEYHPLRDLDHQQAVRSAMDEQALLWGVIPTKRLEYPSTEPVIYHATFSSDEVQPLEMEHIYA